MLKNVTDFSLFSHVTTYRVVLILSESLYPHSIKHFDSFNV